MLLNGEESWTGRIIQLTGQISNFGKGSSGFWIGSINLFAGHPAVLDIKSVSNGSALDFNLGGYAHLKTAEVRAKQLSVEAKQKSILSVNHVETSLAKLSAMDDATITISAGKIETIQTQGKDEQIKLPDAISKHRLGKNEK